MHHPAAAPRCRPQQLWWLLPCLAGAVSCVRTSPQHTRPARLLYASCNNRQHLQTSMMPAAGRSQRWRRTRRRRVP